MAIVEVKVPQLSESVAEATMLTWKKKVGDAVAVDEILIEIETDKVVLEVPAPSAGVLTELVAADGETVMAEQLIARIDTEGKAGAAAPASAASSASSSAAAPAHSAAATTATAQVAAPLGGSMAGVPMPAAAKLMADAGLAQGSVPGTGRDGRVTKGDVLAAPAAAAAPSSPPVAPKSGASNAQPAALRSTLLPQVAASVKPANLGDRPEQRVPMSRLRARIAERLLQSQSTNAILTTFNDAIV